MFRHAFYDDLTGLPNRALFLERLGRAVARSRGRSEAIYAVLYLDLDRFKLVNDGLGHHIGNQLLVAIARRLEQCLRPADTVARLGGDEFTILVDDLKDPEGATQLAERVQASLTAPFSLGGQEVYTSASIGIAVSTHGYHRHEDVLRDADIAMYRAKALGKARYEVFDSAMHLHAVSLLKLETDLRRAVEHDEITAHYQPIVSLATGEITGFEALARWRHPQRGLILPDEFIPLAEETGLILTLGPALLREACREVARLRDTRLTISVNLSARQLADDGLLEEIDGALADAGLAAARLKLEVTESAIMSNADAAIAVLLELRTRGIGIQIDDFGTGYSSLSYLQKLPVDTLKIDRSFVSRIDDGGDKAEIVESIIALARSLDLEVIAEGIETERQLEPAAHAEMRRRAGFPAIEGDAHRGLAVSLPGRAALDAVPCRRGLAALAGRQVTRGEAVLDEALRLVPATISDAPVRSETGEAAARRPHVDGPLCILQSSAVGLGLERDDLARAPQGGIGLVRTVNGGQGVGQDVGPVLRAHGRYLVRHGLKRTRAPGRDRNRIDLPR